MHIKINLKVFIFLLVFLLTRQIKIYAILMLFAFIHELGHLTAGLCMGLKPQSLEIAPYGFSINFKTECYSYNTKLKKANILALKQMLIAMAGPLVNLVIAIFTYVIIFLNKNLETSTAEMVIYSNILIFIFNLLPIYPLDGGRIIKELIYMFNGLEKSYLYTNKISKISIIVLTVVSSIGILVYKNWAILIIIVYLWVIVLKENKYLERKGNLLRILKNNSKH